MSARQARARWVHVAVWSAGLTGLLSLLTATGLLVAMPSHSWMARNGLGSPGALVLPMIATFVGAGVAVRGAWMTQNQFARVPLADAELASRRRWGCGFGGVVLVSFIALVIERSDSLESLAGNLCAGLGAAFSAVFGWQKMDTRVGGLVDPRRARASLQLAAGGLLLAGLGSISGATVVYFGYSKLAPALAATVPGAYQPVPLLIMSLMPLVGAVLPGIALSLLPETSGDSFGALDPTIDSPGERG